MPDEPIARAYLFKGDDERRKQEGLRELLASLTSPDFADFDVERLEGDAATAERVMSGLHIPPFSSARRVVLVRFANRMGEEEQKKLASVLGSAPESGCLILVNPAAEKPDGRAKRGSEVIGELARAVRKGGVVRDFGKMKPQFAMPVAKSLFAEAGKKIGEQALRLFVQRVGGDTTVMASEARKLIAYCADVDSVTERDVTEVTCETPEEKVFKLTDAIAVHNPASALRLLGELFESGDDPAADAPRTLSMIARHFRLLWQAKMLAEAGIRNPKQMESAPESIRGALPSRPNLLEVAGKQSWQAERLFRQAGPFTRRQLARCFTAIARADVALKGMGDIDDPRSVMEMLVVELARPH